MEEYDIAVIGAGPAGSSAAWAASRRGAKTVLIEEHPLIGHPRHCTGRIHGTSFTREILSGMGRHVVIQECRSRRYYSPGGRLFLESPLPPGSVFMVVREEFDREIARQAVRAGAHLLLNKGVSGLVREDGRIGGVRVDSTDSSFTFIRAKVVIVAQGAKGRRNGITRQEGMNDPEETFHDGLMLELTGVPDIEIGVFETFFGAMSPRGYLCLWPRGGDTCLMSGNRTLSALAALQKGKYPICRKIRDAVPTGIHPHILGSKGGVMLPRLVKDGLMLAGDSAGFNGVMHALVSGRLAGEVAAEALRQGDASESRLKRYEELCRSTGLHLTMGAGTS